MDRMSFSEFSELSLWDLVMINYSKKIITHQTSMRFPADNGKLLTVVLNN